MVNREKFESGTSWKMSYEEYKKCYCPDCNREDCVHRESYRRIPRIDGGLALCPRLQNKEKERILL